MSSDIVSSDLNPSTPDVGRTIWDVLSRSRNTILILMGIVVSAALIYFIYKNNPEIISQAWAAIAPYVSLPIFLIFGLLLCRFTFKKLYNPVSRLLFWYDVDNGIIRLIRVPEERFRAMNTVGDSVLIRGTSGIPVYLVNGVTEDSIDFGWIHTIRPELLFAERQFYIDWRDLLEDLLYDNINLMANPEILAADMTRKSLKNTLDGISTALRLERRASQKYSEIKKMVKVQRTDPESPVDPNAKYDDQTFDEEMTDDSD